MMIKNNNTNQCFKDHFLPDSFDGMDDSARLRVNFIVQTLSDAIAFSEDTPVRIRDVGQLREMPKIINELVKDKFIAKQYQEIYGEVIPLQTKIHNAFRKSKLSVFSEEFTTRVQTYFKKIEKLVNDLLESSEFKNIATTFNVEELNRLEDQITDKIARQKDDELDKLIMLLKTSEIQLLEFLVPYLERRIWRIQPSNDTPFVLLMRRGLFWRVYELLWFYEYFKKTVTGNRNLELISAFEILHVRIDAFFIDDSRQLLCMLGPTFEPIGINNSYAFFCKRGLYLKHIFNAFIQLKPEQSADHPGIEELNGALLTRSILPIKERERHIETIQTAWNLLLAATSEYDVDNMSQRDITTLGIYACFVARYSKERFKNLVKNNSFWLGTDPHSINSKHRLSPWYLIYANNAEDYQLIICEDKPKNKKLIDVNLGEGIEKYGERLWCDKKVQEQFYLGKIPQRYYRYSEHATLRSKEYINRRVGALSEWFQRYFSVVDVTDHEESLLGAIGHHTCRLLCELTRADVGATLYHLANDKNNDYRLIIAGDYADDALLLDTRSERQKAIDHDWSNRDAPPILYRKSIMDNRFVYESDCGPNVVVFSPYPETLKPSSVLILPLYMENRVIGLIEVKGTQKSQFRWSQRHTLHQVASVLSPYFYRQNLLGSLSNISRWVFAAGPFALKEGFFGLRKEDKKAWPLNVLARGLSNIFLCRAAQIWLVDKSEQDRFILSGASNPDLIEKVARDEDGETAFILDKGGRNVLQPFCEELWEKSSGMVFAKNPFDFRQMSYREENIAKDQDSLGVFQHYFDNHHFKEMMVFMLTLQTFDINERKVAEKNKYRVIGFVTLFHDHDHGFSTNWRNTIRLVNEQTSMYLEQLDYLRSEEREFFQVTQHEFKQESNVFTNKIDLFIRRANYQNDTLSKIHQAYRKLQDAQLIASKQNKEKTAKEYKLEYLLSTLGSLFSKGIDSAIQQKQALLEAREAYEKLHKKIDAITGSHKMDLFLGLDPNENPVDCNLRGMFNDVYSTRLNELKAKRIKFDNNFPPDFVWKVRREPLRYIIQNLMDNVVKYALEDSTFSAGLLSKESWYIENDTAFDSTIKAPFSAGVRGKRAMDKPGEGFGLYIVKLCAKLIGCNGKFIQKKYPGEMKATIAIDIIKTENKKI